MNYARALHDKPPLHIEDLQVPGEVLIPEPRADDEPSAIDLYQEASNDIYYAEQDADATQSAVGTLPEWERARRENG